MKSRRIDQMEEYILENHQVKTEELVSLFNVSLNTIRRDLNELVKRGTIKKVYGGVQATEIRKLIPFENRHVTEAAEKQALSKQAASLIQDNDIIFIDSGTTTQYMLNFIKPNTPFTLLTNNLDVITLAVNHRSINLIVVGSNYENKTRSFVNMHAQMIESYNINKAFMATSGLTISNGLTNSEHAEYLIKKAIVKKAQKTYLVADHTKFGKSALLTYANLEDIDAIITSSQIPVEFKEAILEKNIDLTCIDFSSSTSH